MLLPSLFVADSEIGNGNDYRGLLGTATSLSPGTAQPPVFTGRELV
jgi:hypothetical protein